MKKLEHTSTASMIVRGLLWLFAGLLVINGAIGVVLDVTGRATDDAPPTWIAFVGAAVVWGVSMIVSFGAQRTTFDMVTGSLTVKRFGVLLSSADANELSEVTVGAVPATAGGFRGAAPLTVVVRGKVEIVIAHGPVDEMETLKTRVDELIARKRTPNAETPNAER